MVFTPLQMTVYNYTGVVATLFTLYTIPMMFQTQTMLNHINDPAKTDYNTMYYLNVPTSPGDTGPFSGSGVHVLYAWGFYVLKDHPIQLVTPNTKNMDVWYTVQILDAYDETITNKPGLDKSKASKNYILVGPEQDISSLYIPENYKLIKCPTNLVWIVCRVGIKNNDLSTASNILHQIQTVDLAPTEDFPNFTPFDNTIYSSMNYYTVAVNLLQYNTIQQNDTGVIGTFNSVGLKAPFVIPPTGSPALQGYVDALNSTINTILPFAFQYSSGLVSSNNWNAGTKLGDFENDYLRRAYAIRSGLAPNIPSEQFYASTFRDSTGATINGALHNYTIHFAADELPEVDPDFGFWDITSYNAAFLLIPNAINRYALCSCNSNDLTYNNDGSLDIYLRYALSNDHTNELPISNGTTNLILRYYSPTNAAIYQFFLPPVVIN